MVLGKIILKISKNMSFCKKREHCTLSVMLSVICANLYLQKRIYNLLGFVSNPIAEDKMFRSSSNSSLFHILFLPVISEISAYPVLVFCFHHIKTLTQTDSLIEPINLDEPFISFNLR